MTPKPQGTEPYAAPPTVGPEPHTPVLQFRPADGDAVPDRVAHPAETPLVLLVEAGGDPGWAADTAIALAAEGARRGRRMVLADLHLAEPTLHQRLGMPNHDGITDIFLYGASLARNAHPAPSGGFFLISAGTPTVDVGEVLRHPRWANLITGLREAGATLLVLVPAGADGLPTLARHAGEAIGLGDLAEDALPAVLPLEVPVRAILVPSLPMPARGTEVLGDAAPDGVDDATDLLAAPTDAFGAASFAAADPTLPPSFGDPTVAAAELDTGLAADPVDAWGSEDQEPEGEALPYMVFAPGVGAAAADSAAVGSTEASHDEPAWEPAATRPVAAPTDDAHLDEPGAWKEETNDAKPARLVSPGLIALLALVVLAAAGYWGWQRFGGGAESASPATIATVESPAATAPPATSDTASAPAAAAPAEPAADPTPDAPELPYSVSVRAFAEPRAATREVQRLARRYPRVRFYVSPEVNQGVVYHRIFAGALPDSAAAQALRTRLVRAGVIDEDDDPAGESNAVAYVPLAFQFGELPDSLAAAVIIDSLAANQIPAYPVSVPFSDGTPRWRVYGGTFADSLAAAGMRPLLERAGLKGARLVTRIGAPPPDSR